MNELTKPGMFMIRMPSNAGRERCQRDNALLRGDGASRWRIRAPPSAAYEDRRPTTVPAEPRDQLDCTAAVPPWLDELNATLPDS
jgi:hypothetical protein